MSSNEVSMVFGSGSELNEETGQYKYMHYGEQILVTALNCTTGLSRDELSVIFAVTEYPCGLDSDKLGKYRKWLRMSKKRADDAFASMALKGLIVLEKNNRWMLASKEVQEQWIENFKKGGAHCNGMGKRQ